MEYEKEMVLMSEKCRRILKVYTKIPQGQEERKFMNINVNVDSEVSDDEIYALGMEISKFIKGDTKVDIHQLNYNYRYVDFSTVDPEKEDDSQKPKDHGKSFEKEFILGPFENTYDTTDLSITDEDFYGDNLDGKDRRCRVYYDGMKGNKLSEAVEVKLTGFDQGKGSNPDGSVSFYSEEKLIRFEDLSEGEKIYRIVKIV
ncbi:hypothetical protein ACFIJ5_18785 (plasmid) [Haloimpatiens sp. FM7330]|uniref:hypothetical protein n=1 Tax=Haloimpatiens sp. FM7330 TaxID=3298610 RepID=UPI0036358E14